MDVRVNDTVSYVVHIPYLSGDQFVPAVGTICRIDFDYEVIQTDGRPPNPGRAPVVVANRLDCLSGRWSILDS